MVQVCRDTRRTWKHDLTILQTVWRPGFKWKTGEWQCVWSRIKKQRQEAQIHKTERGEYKIKRETQNYNLKTVTRRGPIERRK